MPFTEPPICYICKKKHSCDTEDTLQIANKDFAIVNVCKSHTGIQEEFERQENLPKDEKALLAMKILNNQDMKTKMYIHSLQMLGKE